MKYIAKYPSARTDSEPEEGIVKQNQRGACGNCGHMTTFYDQSLDLFVCSDECEKELWNANAG